jgi:hypothetical protein
MKKDRKIIDTGYKNSVQVYQDSLILTWWSILLCSFIPSIKSEFPTGSSLSYQFRNFRKRVLFSLSIHFHIQNAFSLGSTSDPK